MTASIPVLQPHLILYPHTVPEELKLVPQWVPCYPSHHPDPKTGLPIATAKRPMGGPTSPYAKLYPAIYAALHTDQLCGFCFSESDAYICIDLDDTIYLTPKLTQLLSTQPTYTELSISGGGLHIIYRTDKAALQHRLAQDKHTSDYKGSVFIRNQFVVITGNHIPSSPAKISYIDPFVLESLALSPIPSAPAPIPLRQASLTQLQNEANFVIEDIEKWLSRIPTRVNDKVLAIYSMLPNCPSAPDDYEHWRIIAASVHYAAALMGRVEKGLEYFDKWSQGDPAKYSGFSDCQQKYYQNAPKFDNTDISHKTLQKLWNSYRIAWPHPVIKDGKPTGSPIQNDIDNFMALVHHYGLTLQENSVTKALTVVGEPRIVDMYFDGAQEIQDNTQFKSLTLRLMQNEGFRGVGPQTVQSMCQYWYLLKQSYSPVAQRILACPPTNPSRQTYFGQLMETLSIAFVSSTPSEQAMEAQLYASYVKKSLMGIIRAHFYKGPFSSSTGIVILQGAENTYKSTWVRQLLPKDLSSQYVGASQLSSFNDKEIQLEAARWQIVLYDEVEKLMKQNDSKLKSFVVQEYDMYRPLYAQSPVQVPRRCILWGTTNKPTLPITDNGSRRLHIIPIKACDTSKQAALDMMMVYRELYDEFMATPPTQQPALWSLSVEEIVQTNILNEAKRQDNPLESLLSDMCDFEAPFAFQDYCTGPRGAFDRKHRQALNTIGVARKLKFLYETSINTMQLEHTLRRMLGRWTECQDTMPEEIRKIMRDGHYVQHGQYVQNRNWKFWLLPPFKEGK